MDKAAINKFSEVISEYSPEELDEIFEAFKKIRGQDLYFTFAGIKVSNDFTEIEVDGETHRIKTEYAYLELERVRKNELLESRLNKMTRVNGLVENARILSNGGLFCISPCYISGEDIGHTWTRYTPDFRNVKYGAVVEFYSEITNYGELSKKSGVSWDELRYVRTIGGDNTPLYNIQLEVRYVPQDYLRDFGRLPHELVYEPPNLDYTPLRRFDFQDAVIDGRNLSIMYDTFKQKLVLDNQYTITPTSSCQEEINKLLFFEWLVKLREWEFWHFVKNGRR